MVSLVVLASFVLVCRFARFARESDQGAGEAASSGRGCSLVGESQGGCVAIDAALSYRRVDAISLFGKSVPRARGAPLAQRLAFWRSWETETKSFQSASRLKVYEASARVVPPPSRALQYTPSVVSRIEEAVEGSCPAHQFEVRPRAVQSA